LPAPPRIRGAGKVNPTPENILVVLMVRVSGRGRMASRGTAVASLLGLSLCEVAHVGSGLSCHPPTLMGRSIRSVAWAISPLKTRGVCGSGQVNRSFENRRFGLSVRVGGLKLTCPPLEWVVHSRQRPAAVLIVHQSWAKPYTPDANTRPGKGYFLSFSGNAFYCTVS